LIDPNERKWYDDHKSSILRGNNVGSNSNEDVKTDISNLWSYFSHTCYSGPDDGPSGFYTIYRNVFERLDSEENIENVNRTPYPIFGDSSTNPKDVLRFYTFWSNFVTGLSFSWEDQYDSRDAPNRDTRRAIDKESLDILTVRSRTCHFEDASCLSKILIVNPSNRNVPRNFSRDPLWNESAHYWHKIIDKCPRIV
jgi:hypothetical protein